MTFVKRSCLKSTVKMSLSLLLCGFAVMLLVVTTSAYVPTDNKCPAGERYLTCGGCQPSCQNPSPVCTLQCREGCYCPEGLLRDANGNCVSKKECQLKSGKCPIGEIYLSCGSCQRTCDIPNPICTAECREGCYCRDGFLRNSNGKCVSHKQC